MQTLSEGTAKERRIKPRREFFKTFLGAQPCYSMIHHQVEAVTLGPQLRENETLFGIAHIYASFNDTFVHVTDLTGVLSRCHLDGWLQLVPNTDFNLVPRMGVWPKATYAD
eukprot:3286536-Amphidinium_carterae.1